MPNTIHLEASPPNTHLQRDLTHDAQALDHFMLAAHQHLQFLGVQGVLQVALQVLADELALRTENRAAATNVLPLTPHTHLRPTVVIPLMTYGFQLLALNCSSCAAKRSFTPHGSTAAKKKSGSSILLTFSYVNACGGCFSSPYSYVTAWRPLQPPSSAHAAHTHLQVALQGARVGDGPVPHGQSELLLVLRDEHHRLCVRVCVCVHVYVCMCACVYYEKK